MAHQHNQSSKPPDDDAAIPLPCHGRGQPLIPLEELPIFKFLKRQAAETGLPISKLLESPPAQDSGASSDESSDVKQEKDVGIFIRSRKRRLTPYWNSGLEPMQPSQERSEVQCGPSTSKSPAFQSLHSADRPSRTPHTSGPSTSRHHQTDRPTRRSRQLSPSKLHQHHSVPPGKGSPKEPSESDCHGGILRTVRTPSHDKERGASQSAKKARYAAKNASFDPETFSHATDPSTWAQSRYRSATCRPDDDSEDMWKHHRKNHWEDHWKDDSEDVFKDDLTCYCREDEEQHYDLVTFPPDSQDELTDSSQDEAEQYVSSDDSIYYSLSSMSLESTTELMYETAPDVTPEDCSPVPEPAETASPESLEAKHSSQALSTESVYNNIVSSITGTATGLTPESSPPGPKQIKTDIIASTSKVLETKCTSRAVNAEPIHNSSISSRAETCAQETLLCSDAACNTAETDSQAATSMTLEIRGLPKGITVESLCRTVSSFTPVHNICVTVGDEVHANITLTKHCNVSWLMKCLREALALEESGGTCTGGTPAAAVEEKPMEAEKSTESKKDETSSEDEIRRDPACLLHVVGNLPGVEPQSEIVRTTVRELTQGARAKKKGAQDKSKSSKDKQ